MYEDTECTEWEGRPDERRVDNSKHPVDMPGKENTAVVYSYRDEEMLYTYAMSAFTAKGECKCRKWEE